MRRSLLLLLPLTLAACGSSQKHVASPPPVSVHLYGRGRDPGLGLRAGGDSEADRPLRPRTRQPARDDAVLPPAVARCISRARAYEVVYPAYETFPYQAGGLKHLIQGVASRAAARREGRPGRGDRLLARRPAGDGLRKRLLHHRSRAGADRQRLPLRDHGSRCSTSTRSRGHTKVLILAGDRDTTVGTIGASQLVTQLAASGFPYADVQVRDRAFARLVRRRPPVGAERHPGRATGVLDARRPVPRAARKARLTSGTRAWRNWQTRRA